MRDHGRSTDLPWLLVGVPWASGAMVCSQATSGLIRLADGTSSEWPTLAVLCLMRRRAINPFPTAKNTNHSYDTRDHSG